MTPPPPIARMILPLLCLTSWVSAQDYEIVMKDIM